MDCPRRHPVLDQTWIPTDWSPHRQAMPEVRWTPTDCLQLPPETRARRWIPTARGRPVIPGAGALSRRPLLFSLSHSSAKSVLSPFRGYTAVTFFGEGDREVPS